MKTRAQVIVGGMALAMLLSACGGGSDEDAKAADAISASMMAEADEEFPVEQAQADCVGDGLVDKVGVDKLKEYGLLNEDLTVNESVGQVTMEQTQADQAAGVLVGCVDAMKVFTEELGGDESLSAEQQACLSEAITEESLTSMFSLIFQGKDDEATEGMMKPVMDCMMGS